MSIDCSACAEARPVVDVMELYAQLVPAPPKSAEKVEFGVYAELLDAAFYAFLGAIKKEDGVALNVWQGKHGPKHAYLPDLDVKIIAPRYRDGWSIIRVNNPTQSKLRLVQEWLDSYFQDKAVMQSRVKLHKMELSFDFKFTEGGSQDDYAALALRLGRSLHTKYAQNTYAVAIVGKPKRCRDNAVNGKFTMYLQSAKREDRFRLSDRINRNTIASKHTKLYPKKQHGVGGLRIECTPSPKTLNRILEDHHMPFDPENICDVLRICDTIHFSDLYEFKECNSVGFSRYIPKKRRFSERIKACVCRRRLEEVASMPVAEQMRAMSGIRARYGIHPQRKARCIRPISFTEAANKPLPAEFEVSQRLGRHPLPEDVLAEGAGVKHLVPFHEPKRDMEQDTPEQTSLLPAHAPKSHQKALLTCENGNHVTSIGLRNKPAINTDILGDSPSSGPMASPP